MTSDTATVRNRYGIHCRPSAVIFREAKAYTGRIRVVADSGETDLRSVVGLICLGLEPGHTVTIEVDGPAEERFCARLVELFETHFDFPRDQDG